MFGNFLSMPTVSFFGLCDLTENVDNQGTTEPWYDLGTFLAEPTEQRNKGRNGLFTAGHFVEKPTVLFFVFFGLAKFETPGKFEVQLRLLDLELQFAGPLVRACSSQERGGSRRRRGGQTKRSLGCTPWGWFARRLRKRRTSPGENRSTLL